MSLWKAALHAKLEQALAASWIGKLMNGRRNNKVMDAGPLLGSQRNSRKALSGSEQEQQQRTPIDDWSYRFEQQEQPETQAMAQQQHCSPSSLLLESPEVMLQQPGKQSGKQQQACLMPTFEQQDPTGGESSEERVMGLLPTESKLLQVGSKSRGRLAPLQHSVER